MPNDYIVKGAIIGLLANIVKLLVNYTAYLLGFTDVVFWRIAATVLLAKEQLHAPAALLVGAAVDIIVSTSLGIIFLLLVREVVGKEYLELKGIVFGLLTWLLFGVLLGPILASKLPQSISGLLVTVVAHTIFGLSLAFITRRIDAP